ncbi:MAG: hypothetical protein ABJA94_00625 [Rhodoglobus sp.]
MSLNQNFAGPAARRGRLDGADRALDTLVGLVILVVELLIGFLVVYALYLFGVGGGDSSGVTDNLEGGFAFALVGTVAAVAVTTLVYLVRLARARRSWSSPLWGLILLSVACIVGYFIMQS